MKANGKKAESRVLGQRIVRNVGGWTRFMVFVPVVGLLASAATLVIMGAVQTVDVILTLLPGGAPNPEYKEVLVDFIELADLFLLAVVLYIIALGLFELFIDSDLELPAWLQFNDLDDLKYRLLGVVVVVLAVLFLGKAIQIKASQDLFWMGAGIAAVIASIAYFMKGGHGGSSAGTSGEH